MKDFYNPLEEHSVAIAVAVLVALYAWESFRPFFPFFRRDQKRRVGHLLRNFLLGSIHTLLTSLLFILAWKWSTQWAAENGIGLLHWVAMPGWLGFVVALLFLDLWMYWWHRMNHRIPFLWRFHRVHHSDPHMDVTTAERFHFGEVIFSSVLRVPLLILIGAELWHVAVYGTLMFAVVQFHHANIAVPEWLDRVLRAVIVTPEMHKVHHSRVQRETDSNYTSLFSWWDRIFRSFRLRPRDALGEIEIGLDGYDRQDKQSLWGMVKTPFEPEPDVKKTGFDGVDENADRKMKLKNVEG